MCHLAGTPSQHRWHRPGLLSIRPETPTQREVADEPHRFGFKICITGWVDGRNTAKWEIPGYGVSGSVGPILTAIRGHPAALEQPGLHKDIRRPQSHRDSATLP